jgi:lipid-A-disaccharide synthase
MVVAYRLNPITAMIARRLVKVEYASLLNLLSGAEIVPELLQEDCTPARLSAALLPLLADPAAAELQRRRFRSALDSLRPPSGGPPSEAAAREVLRLLNGIQPATHLNDSEGAPRRADRAELAK